MPYWAKPKTIIQHKPTYENLTLKPPPIICSSRQFKGALTMYGKLTWESTHAWNLIILCLLIAWGMTFIFMVHLIFFQLHC